MTFAIIGVIIVVGVIFMGLFGRKTVAEKGRHVDCIRYEDLYSYFRSSEIQKRLNENKNLKLFAQREIVQVDGKQMENVTMAFFDSSKQKSIQIKNGLNLVSENMEDLLVDEFCGNSILYMRNSL